jgi:hypothetical protein
MKHTTFFFVRKLEWRLIKNSALSQRMPHRNNPTQKSMLSAKTKNNNVQVDNETNQTTEATNLEETTLTAILETVNTLAPDQTTLAMGMINFVYSEKSWATSSKNVRSGPRKTGPASR